jgi:xylulose-5-phosphate/fructose-6-phosphate phosphoketolase
LNAVFEVTNRQWDARHRENDEFLAPEGRVMEMLSEHQCQGWLEGYLLTGRHGLFNCYEAFIHIIDSMFNQHAKVAESDCTTAVAAQNRLAELPARLARLAAERTTALPIRTPVSSITWSTRRPPWCGCTCPPDANCLLSVFDHCLRSRHYVNVVIAGKYQAPQWLDMDAAVKRTARRESGSGNGPATTGRGA